MKIFSERLRALREQNNLTQEQMAVNVKMSLKGYRNYETNDNSPKLENLIVIADFFNVSLDYLVGRSDETIIPVFKSKSKIVNKIEIISIFTAMKALLNYNRLEELKEVIDETLKAAREDKQE